MTRTIQLALVVNMSLFSLLACASASSEEVLRSRIDTLVLDEPTSDLVFEQTSTSSGATGDCTSTWIDRWYGTDVSFETVEATYQDKIMDSGWEIWPEDVTAIWRLQDETGLFSFVLVDVSDRINAEREDYVLPTDAVQELETYPTAYLLRLGYMNDLQARRCFG